MRRIVMTCDICGAEGPVKNLYIENTTVHKARRKDACDKCVDKVIRAFGETGTTAKGWPEAWTPATSEAATR
jgi:hypothetical protein